MGARALGHDGTPHQRPSFEPPSACGYAPGCPAPEQRIVRWGSDRFVVMSNRTLGPVIVGVILLVIVIGFVSGRIGHGSTGQTTPRPVAAWTVPSGFTRAADDPTVAYQFATGKGKCDIADRCWNMTVVTQNGCSSLYVELSISDDTGTNVGYTNDTTSGLQSGQQALLVFDNFEERGNRASVSKVSCL